jgi:murein DD-endopeptidase MepM/ murein hydrolase activator NlpD
LAKKLPHLKDNNGNILTLPPPGKSQKSLAKVEETEEEVRQQLKQLSKRPKTLLSITIVTSPDKRPVTLKFGRISGGFALVLGIVILAMAAVTAINIFSSSSPLPTGDNLALRNSATVREQERQRAIDLQEKRLSALAEESNKRKEDINELENRLKELTSSIEALKGFARQLQDLVGSSGTNTSTNPNAPLPTIPPRGSSNPNDYQPPIRTPYGYIDPQQLRGYLVQFNSAVGQLDTFSQLLLTRKELVNNYDQQLASYRNDISRQRGSIEQETNRLSNINNSDGNAPNIMPFPGTISSPFGWRLSPFRAGVREFHYGIDIAVPEGTPVQATKAGIVSFVGYDSGYGNRVEISHGDGWLTLYGHNSRIMVKVGQPVAKGDIIALAGNTGASTGPHIHYEVRKNGVPINPLNYIQQPVRFETWRQ